MSPLAVLAGGNVRVGLEDNIYLSRGRLAGNGEIVSRAVQILEAMNVQCARRGGDARAAPPHLPLDHGPAGAWEGGGDPASESIVMRSIGQPRRGVDADHTGALPTAQPRHRDGEPSSASLATT